MSRPREEHQASYTYSQKPPLPLQGISRLKYHQVLHLASALCQIQVYHLPLITYIQMWKQSTYDLIPKSEERNAVLSQNEQHRLTQVYQNILV